MRTLVDQFGALAQFPVSSPRPIDLNSVVDAALSSLPAGWTTSAWSGDYAADLPLVMADKDALRRALANLIDNAAEAMQGTPHRQITLITGENPGRTMAEIIVADTGPGVTSDMRERLFCHTSPPSSAAPGSVLRSRRKSCRNTGDHPRGGEQASRRALHHRAALRRYDRT